MNPTDPAAIAVQQSAVQSGGSYLDQATRAARTFAYYGLLPIGVAAAANLAVNAFAPHVVRIVRHADALPGGNAERTALFRRTLVERYVNAGPTLEELQVRRELESAERSRRYQRFLYDIDPANLRENIAPWWDERINANELNRLANEPVHFDPGEN